MGPSYTTELVQQENGIVPAPRTGDLSEVSEPIALEEESTGTEKTVTPKRRGTVSFNCSGEMTGI